MNEVQQNPAPKTKSATWLIGLIVVAILVVAGIIFLLLRNDDTNKNDNKAQNGTVNRSSNVNQADNTNTVAIVNGTAINTNTPIDTNASVNANTVVNTNTVANSNTANPDEVTYRNPEFGYSVKYLNPDANHSTATTSNTAQNLYSQWVLMEGDKSVITVQVFPKDKVTEIFSSRKYAKTDATVMLARITSNVLTLDGAKQGLTFDYGSYAFVLLAADKQGTELYTTFETIAKTLTF